MRIVQTITFAKQVKKLHKNQKSALDDAIKDIIKNFAIGEMKKGNLNGIRVYKFSMLHQLTLIAYQVDEMNAELLLLALGSHENFYRDLK